MKLCVLTVPLQSQPAEEAFAYLSGLGVQQLELGAGAFTNDSHLPREILLSDPSKLQQFKDLVARNNLEIAALSCHGNPVHPDKAIASEHHRIYEQTCELAERLGVKTVVTFSGCPGDSEGSKYPNWVTCSWPGDFSSILKWQWEEVMIPYWQKAAQFAKDRGLNVALELHPGFCCYNTASLLRLRDAVGDTIGANFDPSHLFWQGMDPVVAIRELKGAIHHFHAKDTRIYAGNTAKNGVLDTGFYGNLSDRSWIFRTIGYGHDALVWKDIISTLQLCGYDGAISIEHEDALMSTKEGLESAIAFLKNVIIFEKPEHIWWA